MANTRISRPPTISAMVEQALREGESAVAGGFNNDWPIDMAALTAEPGTLTMDSLNMVYDSVVRQESSSSDFFHNAFNSLNNQMSDSNEQIRKGDKVIFTYSSDSYSQPIYRDVEPYATDHGATKYKNVMPENGAEGVIIDDSNGRGIDDPIVVDFGKYEVVVKRFGLKLKEQPELITIKAKEPKVNYDPLANFSQTIGGIIFNTDDIKSAIEHGDRVVSDYKRRIRDLKESIASDMRCIARTKTEKIKLIKKLEIASTSGTPESLAKIKAKIEALPIESGSFLEVDGMKVFVFVTEKMKIQPIQMEDKDYKELIENIMEENDEEHDEFDELSQIFKSQVNKVIGKYMVILFKKPQRSWQWSVLNLTQRSSRGYDGPCISAGSVCLGNMGDKIDALVRNNDLVGILEILIDHATSPTYSANPYREWNEWWGYVQDTTFTEIYKRLLDLFSTENVPQVMRCLGFKVINQLLKNQLEWNGDNMSNRQINDVVETIQKTSLPIQIL